MKNLLRLLRREWLQIVLLAVPFALAAAWWDRMPASVVTHWDIHNRPNGWLPRGPGVLLLPGVNIVLCILVAWAPHIDPRLRQRASNAVPGQRRLWRMCRLCFGGFLAAMSLMIIAVAAGWSLNVGRLCCTGALVLLAVTGNFLANLEPNYLLGIRTPWTLQDPATWRATHRLGSRAMVFGSLAVLAAGVFVPDVVQVGLLIGFVAALALWSLGYSAWFYQTHSAAK